MNSMNLKATGALLIKALSLTICLGVTVTSRAYDFSAPTASGHTLYFNIIDNTQHYVETTFPFVSGTEITGNYITGNLVVPDTVHYAGETWIVRAVGHATFLNCPGMTSCVLPETVVSISGMNAFGQCSSMTSVTLPASLTSIGQYAFAGCNTLQEVHFTGTAEQWCKINFVNWNANPLEQAHTLIINGDTVRDLMLQEGLDTIRLHAFIGCNLRSISIPRSVRMIDADAFKWCDSLTTVYYNADSCGSHNFNWSEPIFVNCPRLTNFFFGDHVVHIPHNLCAGLQGIDTVWLPAGLRSIADGAFSYCSNLRHVDFFHTQLDTIAGGAFYRTALEKVVIPSSCTYIGAGAFEDNDSLRYACIMARNFTWGSGVFSDCPNIDTLRMYASAPPVLTSVLPDSVHLIIPCGAGAYYAHEFPGMYNWNVITDVEEIPAVTVMVEATEGGVASILNEPTCLNMSAEIMAVADSGWHFTSWSDGDTSTHRIFTVDTTDIILTAIFTSDVPDTLWRTVTLLCDSTMGAVSGAGTYPDSSLVVIIATPDSGYVFDSWNDGDTNAVRTILLVSDITFTAYFAPDTTPIPQDTLWRTVSVTTNVSAAEAYGCGVYADSSTVEIGYHLADTTTVGGHWQFLGWNDGGTGNPRDILVTSDTAIVALFEWVADSTEGINELSIFNSQFSIYPNPASMMVTVETDQPSTLTLTDATGRECGQWKVESGKTTLDISTLPAGVYFVRLSTSPTIRKLIIR